MRLFVDYTNWKGVRAWREIEPLKVDFKMEFGRYNEENGDKLNTWLLHVAMVDRNGERRSLRLDHIHGFKTL